MPGPALLDRIDRIMAELAELRAELAPQSGTFVPDYSSTEGNGLDADDFAPESLIDTHAAASRFGFARDTISKMCREVDGIGVWKGGRWQVRIAALRRHLERKNSQ